MEARKTTPKDELYPQVRRWYAKDKGQNDAEGDLVAVAGGSPVVGQ